MVLIGLVSGTLMGLLTLMFGGLFTRLYVLTPDAAAYARNLCWCLRPSGPSLVWR